MKRLRKGCAVVCVAATVAVFVTACAPSEEQRTKDFTELEARGFTNPTFVFGGGLDALVYSVDFGTCRVNLTKGNPAHGWTYGPLDDVDMTRLIEHASDIDLAVCLPPKK